MIYVHCQARSLMDPGVIADTSKGVISSTSGAGITVSTQFGRQE